MKLLLALAVWSGAAWAAKPVQLKLDLAPTKPLRRAAPPPHMPAPVASALMKGDAQAFYRAAEAAEYVAPADDEIQQGLLREAAERRQADRALPQLLAAAESAEAERGLKKSRKTKIDYGEFDRLVALTPRLSLDPFKDVEPKRRILHAAGYTHLKGPGRTRVPIALADDIRVGRAFQHTYRTLERRKNR